MCGDAFFLMSTCMYVSCFRISQEEGERRPELLRWLNPRETSSESPMILCWVTYFEAWHDVEINCELYCAVNPDTGIARQKSK